MITQHPVNIGPLPQVARVPDDGATIIMLIVALVIVHFLQHLNRNSD